MDVQYSNIEYSKTDIHGDRMDVLNAFVSRLASPRRTLSRLLHLPLKPANPLAIGREAILSYDNLLSKACAEADIPEVKRLLEELRTHLVKHNSNLSMLLVNGFVKRGWHEEAAELKTLFQEHNAKYRTARDLINALILNPNNIDLATRDDPALKDLFARLSDGDNTYLFGSLLNLRINISYIEEVWAKMAKYEQKLFGGL